MKISLGKLQRFVFVGGECGARDYREGRVIDNCREPFHPRFYGKKLDKSNRIN